MPSQPILRTSHTSGPQITATRVMPVQNQTPMTTSLRDALERYVSEAGVVRRIGCYGNV